MTDPSLTEEVRRVWRETLQVAEVRDDDDFFALGGTSLLAARAVVALRSALDAFIPVRLIVEHSVFGEFADAVEASARPHAPAGA